MNRTHALIALLIAAALTLAGCSSTPPTPLQQAASLLAQAGATANGPACIVAPVDTQSECDTGSAEAQLAELERLRAALDARAGYGSLWTPERRERAAETARQAAARRRAARAPAAVPEPAPEPAPAPAPARCRACRYLTSSIGHRLACGS